MSVRPAVRPDAGFWWTRDDLGFVDGRLHLAGHDVAALAETVPAPLHLLSAARVTANLTRLRDALAGVGAPSRVYYAMKAIVDPAIPVNAGFYRAIRVVAPEGYCCE